MAKRAVPAKPIRVKDDASAPSTSPTFGAKKILARYVDEANLGKQSRISSSAFMPNPGEQYLSVNSLEIESLGQVADYYRTRISSRPGTVAISCLTIMEYNRACEAGGVTIVFNKSEGRWIFQRDGATTPTYRFRPTHISKSHSGVEPVCMMDSLSAGKFARNLAGRPPGKNPHWE